MPNNAPTAVQNFQSVCLCQSLSDFYQPIWLFRYDPGTREVFILAGVNEVIQIRVFNNGSWRFVNNEAGF